MLAGGWMVPEDTSVTKEIRDMFEKAIGEIDGSKLEPITVLGTQVVSGTNYRILVKATPVVPNPEASWTVFTMYAPISGDPSITDHKDLDV